MKVLKEIVSWVLHIAVAVVCATLINVFIFQPTLVEGSSMESTLHQNDKVIVNKLMHTFKSSPDYGDIVIIDSRVDRQRSLKDDLTDGIKYNAISSLLTHNREEIFWIKRVIGKSGDVLELKDGKIYRNDQLLEETYIKEPMRDISNKKIVVPEGHYFVMGDNRNHSMDSRIIGSVPMDHIMGKYAFKF